MDGGTEILIVGAGIAGLATAYHLARRGARGVLVVEREGAPAQHSTAKSAAILRTSGGGPAVDALARETAAFLRRPPAELGAGGAPLVDARGLVLCAGRAGAAALAREAAPAAAQGRARPLAPDELARRVPGLRTPHGADLAAWLFPEEGRIDVARLVAGLADAARAGGVRFRFGARVAGLDARAGRVQGVLLEGGRRLAAGRVVLAAGAWAGGLGAAAGSRVLLRPTRRHLLVSLGGPPSPAEAPIVWDVERGFYARPERGGWLLCACDQSDVPDPDRLASDPAVLAALREKASAYLDLAGGREESWAGLRTLTADGAFAVGPDPDVAGLFWVAGFGGAGMGSGPAAGRLAAALLAGEPDPLAPATAPARLCSAIMEPR